MLQRYSRHKLNVGVTALAFAIVAGQLLSIASYAAFVGLTLLRPPPTSRGLYRLYHDLRSAPARPLLPYKGEPANAFSAAGSSSAAPVEGVRSDVPAPPMSSVDTTAISECGEQPAVDGSVVPPWSLPTDSSGLDELVRHQVPCCPCAS